MSKQLYEELLQLCKEFWASETGKEVLRKSRDIAANKEKARVEPYKQELEP
jgi:hypothetical protein